MILKIFDAPGMPGHQCTASVRPVKEQTCNAWFHQHLSASKKKYCLSFPRTYLHILYRLYHIPFPGDVPELLYDCGSYDQLTPFPRPKLWARGAKKGCIQRHDRVPTSLHDCGSPHGVALTKATNLGMPSPLHHRL